MLVDTTHYPPHVCWEQREGGGGRGEGAHVPTLTSKVSSPPLTSLTHHKTNFVAHNPQHG